MTHNQAIHDFIQRFMDESYQRAMESIDDALERAGFSTPTEDFRHVTDDEGKDVFLYENEGYFISYPLVHHDTEDEFTIPEQDEYARPESLDDAEGQGRR